MINTQILVIYPQEQSTKIAVYKNMNPQFFKNIVHKADEIPQSDAPCSQCEYRKSEIMKNLAENDVDLKSIGIIIARGGLTKPLKSGVYRVNEKMKTDLQSGILGKHAINLGGWLADELSKLIPGSKAYIADPVVVDEMDDIARFTGHPQFKRHSVFHAANHKHVARRFAQSISRSYEELNLIVAHVGGGGMSIGAHRNGKVVDVNQAFDGEGPFAITRSGTLPAGELVKLCFSGKHTEKEILKLITHQGGMVAYLGTENIYELEKRINSGDKLAIEIADAMAYQLCKEIGAMYTVLSGNADAIILSGEIFQIRHFTDFVSARISKIAKIALFSIVNDMDSLASNGLMAVKGEVNIWDYE